MEQHGDEEREREREKEGERDMKGVRETEERETEDKLSNQQYSLPFRPLMK